MKTQQSIKNAIIKYEEEVARIQGDLEDLDRAWKRAGTVLDNPEFFISCIKEREYLTKELEQFNFKIRFAKWVLDES